MTGLVFNKSIPYTRVNKVVHHVNCTVQWVGETAHVSTLILSLLYYIIIVHSFLYNRIVFKEMYFLTALTSMYLLCNL